MINKVEFGIYTEAYFSFSSLPSLSNRNSNFEYIYNHHKLNQLALNTAILQAKSSTKNVKCNLAIQTGTYAAANYVAEPTIFQYVYEANIAIKLSNKNNIWFDAGIMPSHIGSESAIGSDNPTLTRSLVAENSPYFETGVKCAYTSKNNKWYTAIILLNGWQNIAATIPNNPLAGGFQITYQPSKKLKLNYSNFLGSVPNAKNNRWYQDFFVEWILLPKYKYGITTDIGKDFSVKNKTWYSANTYLQYKPNTKNAIACRLEIFSDPNKVMIASPLLLSNQTNITAASINFDYNIYKNILCRIEPKAILFNHNLPQTNNNYYLFTGSICARF
jgi:Putative beta-barrel porin-2, OmpL-like. bbp2